MHIENSSGAAAGRPRRLVLVGGFLGAGKTTLIGQFSRWLSESGKRVGLVTNDQGKGLMDTDSAQNSTPAANVAEITGGCFCCRLGDLVGVIGRLVTKARPDVIVAEPVGSCTDLMATVVLPLERIYNLPFGLSPLSVVLDARRALVSLGGKRSARDFHRDVGYVFRKQLEEAEWLVVNKIDLLDAADLADLEARLGKEFPGKRVFKVCGRTGEGLEEWFEALLNARSGPSEIMEVDYERYTVGEALLGWVNSEARCETTENGEDFDWGGWLSRTGGSIAAALDMTGHEVGHFKMSVEMGKRRWRVHQVMGDEVPELHVDHLAMHSETPGRFLVNLRAEGRAEDLEAIIDKAIRSQDEVRVEFLERAAFQPGKPEPTHRVLSLA